MTPENKITEAVKILIVDDVDTNRFVLRDIIQEMGYQPVLTENGVQALKIVSHIRPQLIILDVAMPEMDGHEFCRIMKENAATRDIPIIFISAFDDPSDIVKGFNLGGEDYITKPFIPEVVKARLKLHLKLHDSAQKLLEVNRLLQSSINEQLHQLEMEKKNVLYALTCVARENDCYDKKHMERLSYNCRVLSEAMQLSAEYGHLISDSFIDTIEMAAPLCNLGNVAISKDLLQKKGPLTPDETKTLQSHTIIGARILEDIQDTGDYNDFLQMSIEIARYHHEHWDGTGYPFQIKGDEIPLPAQIVFVGNAYCTATKMYVSDNQPNDPLSGSSGQDSEKIENVLHVLETDSGKKFNPDIFHILRRIYRQMH